MAVSTIPHIRFPFRVAGGQVAVVQQDTFDEVAQSVQVILTTSLGARIEVPTFGVEDPVFSTESDTRQQEMLAAIEKWEPRAKATLDITVDNVNEFTHFIRVEIPNRPDDSLFSAFPAEAIESEESEGFGVGGWGIEPWGL